jgi:hypothetical protein
MNAGKKVFDAGGSAPLFSAPKEAIKPVEEKVKEDSPLTGGGGLFGFKTVDDKSKSTGGSLFGKSDGSKPLTGSIFGSKKEDSSPAPSLFGTLPKSEPS